MTTQLYYRDIVERIIELLKDNFQEGYDIQGFFEGDPVEFGTSMLPAVCVMKMKGNYDLGPTQNDRIINSVLIKVVLDKRDDYGASFDVDLTDKRLRQMIEGRDATTGEYDPQSMLGILRT